MKRGGAQLSRAALPSTQPKVAEPMRCGRTCCWTPFGHKVDAPKTCTCHTPKGSIYS